MRSKLRVADPDGRAEPIKFRFSKGSLERFPAPAEGRIFVYDELVPGLCLAVTQAGGRTFYRNGRVDGRPQRVRIGTFPGTSIEQARKVAAKINGQVADGQDPQEAKRNRRAEVTLGDVFNFHLEHFARLKKKTWREDERMFNAYLSPWKNRRLATIRTEEVQAFHTRLGTDHGQYQANRVIELVGKLFSTAAGKLGWKGDNPALAVDRFKEQSRDRFLLPDEVPKLLRAIDDCPDAAWRNYFRLLLLTGVRRANALAARWEQIDWQRAVWRLPETKSGKPVNVELAPQAVEVLEAQREIVTGSPWVFPANRSDSKSGHASQPDKAWRAICAAAGITDLRLHDLRRTLGSWQAIGGASQTIIGASLGHSPGSSATAVYSRLTQSTVRESVTKAVDALLAAGRAK
ncbi:MAG: tyrosine-type recombinase/integrase [Planctomycetia bacterium]|nr:tyrosine-type recombinase/integrase [Planctomycetia bacterium]